MRNYFIKALGTLGYIVQCGCIAHCTFEYVGDFVVVSYHIPLLSFMCNVILLVYWALNGTDNFYQ